ncbi:hypothetical protein GCM10023238_33330 [Streptomyces heliomycini]
MTSTSTSRTSPRSAATRTSSTTGSGTRHALDNTSVDKAASDLTSQGFALGSGLQHVSNRWSTQLNSVLDACAHIANHMQVTKKIHDGDEAYILRQMSSIATLDAGFDERVGPAGEKNPIYGEKKK